ncbi:MAG: hypothetical protein ABEK29_00060 [Bradymonadaceae bacterium]
MDKTQEGPGGLTEEERDEILQELFDRFTLKLDHSAICTNSANELSYVFLRALTGGDVKYRAPDVAGDDPEAKSSMKTAAIALGDTDEHPDAAYMAPVEGIDGEEQSQVNHFIEQTGECFQHIALRIEGGPIDEYRELTEKLGVNYITPLLYDEGDNLLQMFTGSLFRSSNPAAGPFIEINQRMDMTDKDREHFNHQTVQGLYSSIENLQLEDEQNWIIDFDKIPEDWDVFDEDSDNLDD